MYPLISPEMIGSAAQMLLYFMGVLVAAVSFFLNARV